MNDLKEMAAFDHFFERTEKLLLKMFEMSMEESKRQREFYINLVETGRRVAGESKAASDYSDVRLNSLRKEIDETNEDLNELRKQIIDLKSRQK